MLYRKFAVPITAKRADKIITVSENSKKDIIRYCRVHSDKIHVIYNGVDKKFGPIREDLVAKVKRKYDISSKYILFVGTIDHPGKNVCSLIYACRKLWEAGKDDFKLVLVGGEGFGYEKIKKMIDSDKRIRRLGYVEDADLPAIYCGAELFCFLSLYEGFGLPVVEAMACGVPVIVSNCPPLPGIVGVAGIIVRPFDINEISEKINEVLINPMLKGKLRGACLERAKRFSWENAALKTYEVLQSVVSVEKNQWKQQ